jgi:hypothetical protein
VLSECLSLATGEVYDIRNRMSIDWTMFCVLRLNLNQESGTGLGFSTATAVDKPSLSRRGCDYYSNSFVRVSGGSIRSPILIHFFTPSLVASNSASREV